MIKVNFEQCLTNDKKNNKNILITTGATINDQHYLTTQMVTAKFKISENSLRKLYTIKGKEFEDYFYSDTRTFLNERFLFNKKIKTRSKCRSIPYKVIETEHPKKKIVSIPNIKGKILKEIKQMPWDDFLCVAPTSFMSRDDWDVAMMKLCDLLAEESRSKEVRIAYSTELSVNIKNKHVVSKYDDSHRHIHFLLYNGSKKINPKVLKRKILIAIGKTKFKKYEYYAEGFKENIFGENYILKTYQRDTDCFSMCAPDPLLVL